GWNDVYTKNPPPIRARVTRMRIADRIYLLPLPGTPATLRICSGDACVATTEDREYRREGPQFTSPPRRHRASSAPPGPGRCAGPGRRSVGPMRPADSRPV